MKLWKAELILFYNFDEELQIKFPFELQREDYEINKYNDKEWIYCDDWIVEKVPMNMIIKRVYDNYKIIQGFDHELSEDELKQLEKDMRDAMRKQLDYDKELYLKKCEEKLKVIMSK